jgi:predicted nucleic acid-binding protein
VNITLDLNVLLDVFQKREPHYAASAQVLALVVSAQVTGVFPSHGFTTLYYLVRKHASKPHAEAAMDRLLDHLQIGNLDADGWREARRLEFEDFEDAVVAVIAKKHLSDFIISRNVDDFAHSPVPVITPTDFLIEFPIQNQ